MFSNLFLSLLGEITFNMFGNKFSNKINDIFTSFCNAVLKPRVTKTLDFQCKCNYTQEYVQELLWYKNNYYDMNLLFITVYIGFLSTVMFLFVTSYNSVLNEVNEKSRENDGKLNIKYKIDSILNDIDIMNTIKEEPNETDFVDIPLTENNLNDTSNNETQQKKRKLMSFNQQDDYIKL